MHRPALNRNRLSSTQTWIAAMSFAVSTYLLLLAGGRSIPAPLRIVLWGVPIGMSWIALSYLPEMEQDQDELMGMNALIRQQREHGVIRQHQLDLATREMEYLSTLAELKNGYGLNVEAPSPGADGQWGFSLGSPFALLEAGVPLDRQVIEQLGEPALTLWHYASQRAHNWCDKDGWMPIDKLRDNWGKRRGIDTEGIRQILSGLNSLGIGSWKDARLRDWRLEIPG